MKNYIYILRRSDGRPFYVGQGAGPRVFFHENEARHANNWRTNHHKLNVIRSIWRVKQPIVYEIDFLSEDLNAINERETELIRLFGRLHEGGCLTNRDPGARSLQETSPFERKTPGDAFRDSRGRSGTRNAQPIRTCHGSDEICRAETSPPHHYPESDPAEPGILPAVPSTGCCTGRMHPLSFVR